MNATSTHALLAQSKQAVSSFPADLRSVLGWRGLAALVLNSVSLLPSPSAARTTKSALLLTLCTYSYAAQVLASSEIELALADQADLAYLTRGVTVTAGDIRRFRRQNRAQIEDCLAKVYLHWAKPEPTGAHSQEDFQLAAEFVRGRVQLAVLFDTALAE